MVGGAVALDAQQVAARPVRVADGEVDEETRQPDLRMDLIPRARSALPTASSKTLSGSRPLTAARASLPVRA